jgi:hypothetical protein
MTNEVKDLHLAIPHDLIAERLSNGSALDPRGRAAVQVFYCFNDCGKSGVIHLAHHHGVTGRFVGSTQSPTSSLSLGFERARLVGGNFNSTLPITIVARTSAKNIEPRRTSRVVDSGQKTYVSVSTPARGTRTLRIVANPGNTRPSTALTGRAGSTSTAPSERATLFGSKRPPGNPVSTMASRSTIPFGPMI